MLNLSTFEELKCNNIDDNDFELGLQSSEHQRITFGLNIYFDNMVEGISECFFAVFLFSKCMVHQEISTFYSKKEFVC